MSKRKSKNGIFAAVGAATGLGNAFRFPALCVKYGAPFFAAYAFVLAFVSFPLLIAELSFGRRNLSGKGAKVWGVIMCAAAANSALIALYYGVIAANLGCASINFALFGGQRADFPPLFFAVLAAVLVAVYALIKGAPRSLSASGRASVTLSLALFCPLAVAGAVRGGAFSSFNFAAFAGAEIWIDALGQSLLSLSLAAGVMPAYAKTLKKGEPSARAAFKIVAANFMACMLATLSVLPFSVTFSRTVGVNCAINAYSQVISALFGGGLAARFFGAALFAALTVVAVHSLASLAYPALNKAAEKTRRAPAIFCIAALCLAPLFSCNDMFILSVCDKIACSVNAVAIAVTECLFFLSRRHITGGIA
ncbi:MAG: hypothetical protein NC131_05625 [Roseburia sp.]|nr:hypothetical protein [Roseburia sp.]